MKSFLSEVFEHPALQNKPPVLIDVGASGALPEQWKLIAPYSICVAFDADTRDFNVTESDSGGYRKLYLLNRLVAAKSAEEVDFYLTRSPYCSSSLHPDNAALKPWAFSGLFEVDRAVAMPAVDLVGALGAIGIDYLDWYKSDSQGTDLRIFKALPASTISKVIAAEFEPGIIDAYLGEDKLHQLMSYMDSESFWITRMRIKGSQRIDQEDLAELNGLQRRYIGSFLKMAPGWCEISYLNKFDTGTMGLREYLLGWVFSSIYQEYGFALHLAKEGKAIFNEPLFDEMEVISKKALTGGYFKLAVRAFDKLVGLMAGFSK
ncbi:MAG: hypothetical protein KGZ69_11000 [Methylomonas sp.]|nr:hypothetical protein [Methylomonas sp.]